MASQHIQAAPCYCGFVIDDDETDTDEDVAQAKKYRWNEGDDDDTDTDDDVVAAKRLPIVGAGIRLGGVGGRTVWVQSECQEEDT